MEVSADNSGLILRPIFKLPVQVLEPITGYPPVPLRPLGNDTFVCVGWLPGMPNTHFQFTSRRSDGRMQYLAYMFRLMARV
jgi:hypothetical protein